MKFHETICPICHDKNNFTVLYEQNFTSQQVTVDVFSARRLPDRLHYRLVRCNHDGLVRSNPILSYKDLSTLYTKSRFTYDEEVEPLIESYMNALAPVLERLPKSARILEVGCGNGFILRELMNRGFSNVYGVEPSTEAVSKAPKKLQKRIKIEMFSPSLFPTHSFDFIFIFQTLDHIPMPDVFLFGCEELLGSNGQLLSFHHNIQSLSSKLLKEKSPIIDVEHTQLFSMETSRKLFERCGFEVTSVISPVSQVSLRHLCWLFPFPKKFKNWIVGVRYPLIDPLLRLTIPVSLGNTCIVGKRRV